MSTSLLYHGFLVRGIEYQRTEYRAGNVIFFVALKPKPFVALRVEDAI